MGEHDGRVAVITGASRGIGAGLARALHRAGLSLGLCARSAPAAGELPDDEERILFHRADVAEAEQVDAFADAVWERFGGIDLWVNNAGLLEPIGMVRDVDPAAFGQHLDVNVKGVFHGTRAFLRLRHRAGGGGALVNVSSGAATSAYEGWGAYCAGKAAVDMLTRVAAREEAPHGIRVFALAPGIIETRMQEQIRAADAGDFPAVGKFRELHDSGALADPESPAAAVLRLAFGGPLPEGTDPVLDVRDSPELADVR